MKLYIGLYSIVFSLFFSACSLRDSSQATLRVAVGAQVDMSQYPGGLVIWGERTDGADQFGEVLPSDASGELSISLPNGKWNFYAVGWQDDRNQGDWVSGDPVTSTSCTTIGQFYTNYDGSTNFLYCDTSLQWNSVTTVPNLTPMNGKVMCALSVDNDLNGGQLDIDLTLSNSNCNNSIFATNVNGTGTDSDPYYFPRISYIANCKDISSLGTSFSSSPCMDTSERGFVQSVKIKIPSFRVGDTDVDFPIVGEPLEVCVNTKADGTFTVPGNLNVPTGNMQAPLRVEVESFFTTDCSVTSELPSYVSILDKSFLAPSGVEIKPGIKSLIGYNSSEYQTELFISTPHAFFCSMPKNTYGLHLGDGSSYDKPLGICSAQELVSASQLVTMNTTVGSPKTGSNAFYALFADLDMNPLTIAVGYTGLPYQDSGCLSIGDNFIPFGASYSGSASGSDCAYAVSNAFTGQFDGLNHIIANLRFQDRDKASSVGLFAELGTDALVANILIDQAEISGLSYVGLLAGKGGSAGSIENILIQSSRVEAGNDAGTSYVGGIIGSASSVGLSDIHFLSGEVRGEGNYIGGLAGDSEGSVSNSNASVAVLADHSGSTIDYVGGIIGKGLSGSSIGNSFFEGVVISPDAANVGFMDGENNVSYDNTSNSSNHASGVRVYTPSSSTETTFAPEFDMSKAFTWEVDLHNAFADFHPCLESNNLATVADQVSAGRGSETNPVILCNQGQFLNIKNYPAKAYLVRANIYLQEMFSDRLSDFNGQLSGDGHMLYGLTLTRSASDTGNYLSLFKKFSGVMQNLTFVGLTASSGGYAGGGIAPLIGENTGTVKNIKVFNVSVSTDQNDGMIAGAIAVNSGTVDGLLVDGYLGNLNYANQLSIGGAIGLNKNIATRIKSSTNIVVDDSTAGHDFTDTIGGVVSNNAAGAKLSQAIFAGNITAGENGGTTVTYSGNLGGLVAENSGTIEDCEINRWSSFMLTVGTNAKLAPMVAVNDGTIKRIFYGGLFSFANSDPSAIGPLVASGTYTDGKYLFGAYKFIEGQNLDSPSYSACTDNSSATLTVASATSSVVSGHFAAIDYDQLRTRLFPVTADPSSTSVPVTIDVPCSDLDPTSGSFVKFYATAGSTNSDLLSLSAAADLDSYANWDIQFDDFLGGTMNEDVLNAYLHNDPSLGPVWVLSDKDNTIMPTLFWGNFN